MRSGTLGTVTVRPTTSVAVISAKAGGGGGECQRGGEQEFFHVNLLNGRKKDAENGARIIGVAERVKGEKFLD